MIYKVFVSYRRPGEGIRWKIFRASTVKNANARVELIAEARLCIMSGLRGAGSERAR